MPATLTTPVTPAAFASISDVEIQASAERPKVSLFVECVDSTGAAMPNQQFVMTPAAFLAAMQGASGTWKQRVYAVALVQMGQTATVT